MPSTIEDDRLGKGVEDGDEVKDQSPIEQVSLTVPVTDDPSLPVMTFRMWSLGLLSCIMLMFINTFFFPTERSPWLYLPFFL